MKRYDASRLPSMIELGYDSENNWRPNAFDCSSLLKNHPNGVLSLWLLPNGESQAFPVALERDGVAYSEANDPAALGRTYVEGELMPPEEQPDRTEEESAITRYANSLTGANDPDLLSAAETMITKLSKEES